jgi:hypothetical protein
MSSNDLILLNQLLNQRFLDIGQGLTDSEYFEIFSAEQFLKDDDLTYDELEAGIIDGGGDGGIDSLYFFINNQLYNDDIDVSALKRNVMLKLVMIQSKSTEGFSETGIEKLISSARDIFDLNQDIENLRAVYL